MVAASGDRLCGRMAGWGRREATTVSAGQRRRLVSPPERTVTRPGSTAALHSLPALPSPSNQGRESGRRQGSPTSFPRPISKPSTGRSCAGDTRTFTAALTSTAADQTVANRETMGVITGLISRALRDAETISRMTLVVVGLKETEETSEADLMETGALTGVVSMETEVALKLAVEDFMAIGVGSMGIEVGLKEALWTSEMGSLETEEALTGNGVGLKGTGEALKETEEVLDKEEVSRDRHDSPGRHSSGSRGAAGADFTIAGGTRVRLTVVASKADGAGVASVAATITVGKKVGAGGAEGGGPLGGVAGEAEAGATGEILVKSCCYCYSRTGLSVNHLGKL